MLDCLGTDRRGGGWGWRGGSSSGGIEQLIPPSVTHQSYKDINVSLSFTHTHTLSLSFSDTLTLSNTLKHNVSPPELSNKPLTHQHTLLYLW